MRDRNDKMGRIGPTIQTIEEHFLQSLRADRPVTSHSELVRQYEQITKVCTRTAQRHLRMLTEAISRGEVAEMDCYTGPQGRMYGRSRDEEFANARRDAEPARKPEQGVFLGGVFGWCHTRFEWTDCPVTGRLLQATLITVGVGEFMECGLCERVHFLGVAPKMKEERPEAWQLDPLVNWEDYAQALTSQFMGANSPPSNREYLESKGRARFVGMYFRSGPYAVDKKDQPDQYRILRKAGRLWEPRRPKGRTTVQSPRQPSPSRRGRGRGK